MCFPDPSGGGIKPLKTAVIPMKKTGSCITKLKASRKKPGLQYWFYAGAAEEKGDRDKDSIIDVIDDTKDIIALLEKKNVVAPEGIGLQGIPIRYS